MHFIKQTYFLYAGATYSGFSSATLACLRIASLGLSSYGSSFCTTSVCTTYWDNVPPLLASRPPEPEVHSLQ